MMNTNELQELVSQKLSEYEKEYLERSKVALMSFLSEQGYNPEYTKDYMSNFQAELAKEGKVLNQYQPNAEPKLINNVWVMYKPTPYFKIDKTYKNNE